MFERRAGGSKAIIPIDSYENGRETEYHLPNQVGPISFLSRVRTEDRPFPRCPWSASLCPTLRPELPAPQPRAVQLLRLLTLALIVFVAGLGGGLSYKLLRDRERAMVRRRAPFMQFRNRPSSVSSMISRPRIGRRDSLFLRSPVHRPSLVSHLSASVEMRSWSASLSTPYR